MNILEIFKHKKPDNSKNYPIRLTDLEQKFLLENIQDSVYYLEFGSGGSTFLALLKTNIPHIFSVESDMGWLEHLRKWNCITTSEKDKRLHFLHINIGKTGDWGYPVETEKKALFPNYSSLPFEQKQKVKFDSVFIDGRFRVACALQTILNSDANTKILMHDFTFRPEYHVILDFLDIVDVMDTMALFKLKKDFSKKDVLAMYNQYKYNFA